MRKVILFCNKDLGFYPYAIYVPIDLLDEKAKKEIELLKSQSNINNIVKIRFDQKTGEPLDKLPREINEIYMKWDNYARNPDPYPGEEEEYEKYCPKYIKEAYSYYPSDKDMSHDMKWILNKIITMKEINNQKIEIVDQIIYLYVFA